MSQTTNTFIQQDLFLISFEFFFKPFFLGFCLSGKWGEINILSSNVCDILSDNDILNLKIILDLESWGFVEGAVHLEKNRL